MGVNRLAVAVQIYRLLSCVASKPSTVENLTSLHPLKVHTGQRGVDLEPSMSVSHDHHGELTILMKGRYLDGDNQRLRWNR